MTTYLWLCVGLVGLYCLRALHQRRVQRLVGRIAASGGTAIRLRGHPDNLNDMLAVARRFGWEAGSGDETPQVGSLIITPESNAALRHKAEMLAAMETTGLITGGASPAYAPVTGTKASDS